MSSGIHLSAILQEIPQPYQSLKLTWKLLIYLKFCSNLPGANELRNAYKKGVLMTSNMARYLSMVGPSAAVSTKQPGM